MARPKFNISTSADLVLLHQFFEVLQCHLGITKTLLKDISVLSKATSS